MKEYENDHESGVPQGSLLGPPVQGQVKYDGYECFKITST